jgi:hypothetical protein
LSDDILEKLPALVHVGQHMPSMRPSSDLSDDILEKLPALVHVGQHMPSMRPSSDVSDDISIVPANLR